MTLDLVLKQFNFNIAISPCGEDFVMKGIKCHFTDCVRNFHIGLFIVAT